jgi:hypothetical protein
VSTTELPSDLLTALFEADVEFIVVGGMAAVFHGAPITTNDLDIVHRRTPENIAKLLQVLRTDLGPLDVLCELEPGESYDELIAQTEKFSDGGSEIRVLSLEKLIEIKRRTDRAKDRLVLAELVATLSEKKRSS